MNDSTLPLSLKEAHPEIFKLSKLLADVFTDLGLGEMAFSSEVLNEERRDLGHCKHLQLFPDLTTGTVLAMAWPSLKEAPDLWRFSIVHNFYVGEKLGPIDTPNTAPTHDHLFGEIHPDRVPEYTEIILEGLHTVTSTIVSTVRYLDFPHEGIGTALDGLDVAIQLLVKTKRELIKASGKPPRFLSFNSITGYYLGWWHCSEKQPPLYDRVLFVNPSEDVPHVRTGFLTDDNTDSDELLIVFNRAIAFDDSIGWDRAKAGYWWRQFETPQIGDELYKKDKQ